MRKTTPELAPPSPNFRILPKGERTTHDIRFNMHQTQKQGGFSVETDFEPGTFGSEAKTLPLLTQQYIPELGSGDLSTRSPQLVLKRIKRK
ncbi:hypothetical protein AVEN_83227-1 [Araneus ventricosus]|uniref:Uncharacterized protein n=1 Tax=Araneus ventricosus TaxID=182803 RepID=A0A4Y2VWI5_ARAVE|nr:hypothetical protein AVEN_83227-1 [Araneus ventricosus]